ncbi:MAG: polyprenol monophosphomannose synthase [Pseudoxanthomonas sp.]
MSAASPASTVLAFARESRRAGAAAPRPVDLAIVVPTRNEAGNIAELVRQVARALEGVDWEMLVVDDDSSDGTAAQVTELHRWQPRVRVLRRIGRRGLASACVEGMLATPARYLAVIDADLQHDPALLRCMHASLRQGNDLVVASRYTGGGSIGQWSAGRAHLGRLGNALARLCTGTTLSDPMSGYFALRRDVLDGCAHRLSGNGFKILLELVACAGPGLAVDELPYTFGTRLHGQSKLRPRVLAQALWLLARAGLRRLGGRPAPVPAGP